MTNFLYKGSVDSRQISLDARLILWILHLISIARLASCEQWGMSERQYKQSKYARPGKVIKLSTGSPIWREQSQFFLNAGCRALVRFWLFWIYTLWGIVRLYVFILNPKWIVYSTKHCSCKHSLSLNGFSYKCWPCNPGGPFPGIRCLRSIDRSLIAKESKQ